MQMRRVIYTFVSRFKFQSIFRPNNVNYWKKPHGLNFRKEQMKRVLFAVSVLMVSMLACQITGLSTAQPTPVLHTQTNPPALPTPANSSEIETTLEALYQQVLPGVVAIKTSSAEGSGFVFDSDGHIVTNQHVIEGSSDVEIDFSSGFKAHGTVIGSDTDADVAVIQVKAAADQIHPLAMG